MASDIGRKVKITTDDGQYIGIIHSIDSNEERLTLAEVTCVDTGKAVRGLLHFYSNEVEDVIPVDEEKKNWVNNDRVSRSVLKTKLKPAHLVDLKPTKPSELLLSNILSEKHAGEKSLPATTQARVQQIAQDQAKRRKGKESDPELEINYTLINTYNGTFDDAVRHLKAQDIIGLSAQGVDMGRHGHLCWLAMASRQKTYLFDIIMLGDNCLKSGLASILQSVHIQKVIHNCRRLSDLMYHKYNIDLVNVFDTQVAYVTIYHNKTGVYPRYVEPLSNLLSTVLNIDKELIHVSKIRISNALADEYAWCQRPATETMLKCLAKTVMHLLRLRQTLLEMMLADFVRGVGIYLSCLRELEDDGLYSTQLNCQHMLPSEFADLQLRRNPHRATSYCDKNGFRENIISCTKSAPERTQSPQSSGGQQDAANLGAQGFKTKQSSARCLASQSSDVTETDLACASDQQGSANMLNPLALDLQRIAISANSSQLSCDERGKKLIAAGHEVTMLHTVSSKKTNPEGWPAQKKDKGDIAVCAKAGCLQVPDSTDGAEFIQQVSARMKAQRQISTSTPRHKVQGSLTSLQTSTKSNQDSSKKDPLSSSVRTDNTSNESNSEGANGLECQTEGSHRVANAKKSYEVLERASKILSEVSLSEELLNVLDCARTSLAKSGSNSGSSDSLSLACANIGRIHDGLSGTPNDVMTGTSVCSEALSTQYNVGRGQAVVSGRGALGLSSVINIGRGHVKKDQITSRFEM